MFFFLPLGPDGGTVRVPVVGALIALLCILAFLPTYALNDNPDGVDEAQLETSVAYWRNRPYLTLPGLLSARLAGPMVAGLEAEKKAWLEEHRPPDQGVIDAEQAELDATVASALESAERTPLRRFAMVSSRGLAQPGWLTHMFLHYGWLHLLGNLLFLWVVAPLLEDAWGRGLFGAFYLLGGVAAAAAYFAMDRHSAATMVGASGAIAACMGAFAVRFSSRRILVAYFILFGFKPLRGIWKVPAWAAGILWLGNEVLTLVFGSGEGVAVSAHVGGFAFGAAVALAMKGIGLEKTLVSTDEAAPQLHAVPDAVNIARLAVAGGDLQTGREEFTKALAAFPNDFDARWELGMLELQAGNRVEAVAHLEKALLTLVRERKLERAGSLLLSIWRTLSAEDFSPSFSFQLAKVCEPDPAARELTLALYRRAGDEPTLLGAKALVRYAELGVGAGVEGHELLTALEQAREVPDLPKEVLTHIDALTVRARGKLGIADGGRGGVGSMAMSASSGEGGAASVVHGAYDTVMSPVQARPSAPLALAPSGPSAHDTLLSSQRPAPAPAPGSLASRLRVVPCVVTALSNEGLTIEAAPGQARPLPFAQVKAVAVAVLPVEGTGGTKGRLVVDLVMSWGTVESPGMVVRLDSHLSGLHRYFPTVPPQQAWLAFVSGLLKRSPAQAIPGTEALARGQFPRFQTEAELIEALARHAPGEGFG